MAELQELTDEELSRLDGSHAAKEKERRALRWATADRAAGGRQYAGDQMARGRAVMLAHSVGPRDLRDALRPRPSAPDAVTVDRRAFEESARRVRAAHERIAADGLAAAAERPRMSTLPGTPPPDQWALLARRARAGLRADQLTDHGPAADRIDPDSLSAENRMLGTPGAGVVAKEGRR